jgi:hypothetical protein
MLTLTVPGSGYPGIDCSDSAPSGSTKQAYAGRAAVIAKSLAKMPTKFPPISAAERLR